MMKFTLLLAMLAGLMAGAVRAGEEDHPVAVPAFDLPMSSYASAAAAKRLHEIRTTPQPDLSDDIATLREFYDRQNQARLDLMQTRFAVTVRKSDVAGVPVQIVEPKDGVPAANKNRLLINLHGGAFLWGAGAGELVEAVPIAATLGVQVITVDYRQGPEYRFPAGSEDVTKVYEAALKGHAAKAIGLYGCSAGGILTAQATAMIIERGLPVPGAIGTFCGTGLDYGGDSAFLEAPLNGKAPTGGLTMKRLPYFAGVSGADRLMVPAEYPDLLAKFPPTLLLAGSRDFAASSLTVMKRRLAAAGVPSELFLFDGLWHAFFVDVDLPESEEAYQLISGFFDRRLAR